MIDLRLHLRVILTVLVAIGTVFLCPAQVVTPAPDRGVTLEPEKTVATAPGHRYIVSIGINDYDHWPKLATAVNDATGFAQLLKTQFGFEDAAPPLTNAAAKREAIVSLIDDDLRAKLKPDDDLVIFFAGHGTTRTDTVGAAVTKTGYIVPYEAHAPGVGERWSEYVNVDEFLRMVSTLPPKHVLVILDSCHSGMALGSGFSGSRGSERFTADMQRQVSRKVISSAQGDQLAADSGPLPGHSLFMGLLMQGLSTGKADNFDQGFITSNQLGSFVQHEVSTAQESRQTPLFGAFYGDAGGDLVLPTAGDFASLFQRAAEALRHYDLTGFEEASSKALEAPHDPTRALWISYMRSLNQPDFRSASARLLLLSKDLRSRAATDNPLPLNAAQIDSSRYLLNYWLPASHIPQIGTEVELSIGIVGQPTRQIHPRDVIHLPKGSAVRLVIKSRKESRLYPALITLDSDGLIELQPILEHMQETYIQKDERILYNMYGPDTGKAYRFWFIVASQAKSGVFTGSTSYSGRKSLHEDEDQTESVVLVDGHQMMFTVVYDEP